MRAGQGARYFRWDILGIDEDTIMQPSKLSDGGETEIKASYKRQIEAYLNAGKDARNLQWFSDGPIINGMRLFGTCGSRGRYLDCGCPTLVKGGDFEACTDQITDMIRAANLPASYRDLRKGGAPLDLTRTQLETIAAIQLEAWKNYHPTKTGG